MFRNNCELKANNLELLSGDKIPINQDCLGYDNQLIYIKNQIDDIDINLWNQVRRYTNNFEFPLKRNVGCNPISRAFFKLWEILSEMEIPDTHTNFLCLAEAPGGFVQAILKYFEGVEKIYTISLVKESDINVPKYSDLISENPKVHIINTHNGDLCNPKVVSSIKDKFSFITADGGFNELNEFNIKEQLHYKLFFSEMLIALNCQEYNGIFIIKFFDTYTRFSCEMLFILSFFYDELIIFKPLTSRPTNSEKYIILKNFKKLTKQHKKIRKKLNNFLKEIDKFTSGILNISLPEHYIQFIKKINIQHSEKQMNCIQENIKVLSDNCNKEGYFVPPSIFRNNERLKWLKKYNLV